MSIGVRKNLTLPSGATTVIRRLCPMDFMSIATKVPNTTAMAKNDDETYRPTEDQLAYSIAIEKLCLLKACGAFTFQGRKYVIVDKPHYDLIQHRTHTEVCIEDLPQEDANQIIREVFAISNIGKEDAAQAATFPEGSKASADGSQAG